MSVSLLHCLPQLLATHRHTLSLLYLNLTTSHLCFNLPPAPPSSFNTIFSQSGVRVKAMPGEIGINLSPYHSCFLLLPACLIKLPPLTHAHRSPFLNPLPPMPSLPFPALFLLLLSWILFPLSASFPQSVLKNIQLLCLLGWLSLSRDSLFLDVNYNTHRNNDCGCCFIVIKFPTLFLLPSCVPVCPRSKCQQDLGTWSGIWCHITQRTWIQKTSQHAELTWSAAKPAATC